MGDISTNAASAAPTHGFELATRQVAQKRNWGESLSAAERTQIKKTALDFEAMYLSDMMNYMMADMDMSETSFGGGTGEKMYQSMMANEYGKQLAKSGQVGIAPVLEREMLRMQELQRNPRLATAPTSAPKHTPPHLSQPVEVSP